MSRVRKSISDANDGTSIALLKEIAYDSYRDVYEIFRNDRSIVEGFRRRYGECLSIAEELKGIFNANGILAEIVTFKNGNAFLDVGIKVYDKVYMFHCVLLLGDDIIDILHTDAIVPTKEYIEMLEKDNSKLRIDYSISTNWYNKAGYPIKLDLDYLKNYKY